MATDKQTRAARRNIVKAKDAASRLTHVKHCARKGAEGIPLCIRCI